MKKFRGDSAVLSCLFRTLNGGTSFLRRRRSSLAQTKARGVVRFINTAENRFCVVLTFGGGGWGARRKNVVKFITYIYLSFSLRSNTTKYQTYPLVQKNWKMELRHDYLANAYTFFVLFSYHYIITDRYFKNFLGRWDITTYVYECFVFFITYVFK